jgi:hypothetical protein
LENSFKTGAGEAAYFMVAGEEGKEDFTLIIVYRKFKYFSRQTNRCRALLFELLTKLYS